MSAVPLTLPPSIREAVKKAGIVWVSVEGGRPMVLWHLWHNGAVWTVVGGAEQQLPVGSLAVVTVRGAQRELAASFAVDVSTVEPGSELWDEVVPLLHAKRLNAPDGEEQPARWARESRVLRLQPTGALVPPGDGPDLAEPPVRGHLQG